MNEFKKNNRVQRTAIAIAIAGALSSSAAMAALEEDTNTSDVEVIEVRGIAGSMAESARQKRFDSRIVDAIVAEDIGKLPDNNIAEALSRITGVSMKSDFGVGESVTIRGISDNRVELNGRSTSGSGRGGISLSDFPSSFLKTVEVVKSPTPEMIEGALGGTVNMKTIRPLELKEPLIAVTLDYEYADKTEHYAPKFSFAAGDNWDFGSAGTFGANFVASYLDREIRQDEFSTKTNTTASLDGFDEEANGPDGLFTYRNESNVIITEQTRERRAYATSFQWAPESAEGSIYLDLSYSELEGGGEGYQSISVFGTLKATDDTFQDSNGVLRNYQLADGVGAIPKTESDFTENDGYSHALGGEWQLTDQFKIAGEVAITGSDDHQVESQINSRPIDRELYDPVYEADPTISPDKRPDYYNLYTETYNLDGALPSIESTDPYAFYNPAHLVMRGMEYVKKDTENQEVAARFDVEYTEPMGIEWISAVKGGVRVTNRQYNYDEYEVNVGEGDKTYNLKDIYKKAFIADADGNATDVHLRPTWLDEFSDQYGQIIEVNHSDPFDQAGGAGSNYLTNGGLFYDAGLLASNPNIAFKTLQAMLEGTNYSSTGDLHENLKWKDDKYSDIDESTLALYTQFHLDFDEVTAVIGVRYVETELDSQVVFQGSEAEAAALAEVNSDISYGIADNGNIVLNGNNEYHDWLPSLNVNWNITEDTILRFAAAKVMRRADFGELSPALDTKSTLITGTQGAYDLNPHRVSQYDLSLEHYFGEGGLVSAAVFYKDVSSFLSSDNDCVYNPGVAANQEVGDEWATVCLLNAPGEDNPEIETLSTDDYTNTEGTTVAEGLRDTGYTGINVAKSENGDDGKVTGFELAYQQQFAFLPGAWSGLGVSTNYTYADSEQPNNIPLENISRHTANVQVYWEGEKLQMRLAYNWRDRFLHDDDENKRTQNGGSKGYGSNASTDPTSDYYDESAGDSYQESRGQLDFSTSYDVNENLTIVGNATNITGEEYSYTTSLGTDWNLRESDRRYTIGIRAKF